MVFINKEKRYNPSHVIIVKVSPSGDSTHEHILYIISLTWKFNQQNIHFVLRVKCSSGEERKGVWEGNQAVYTLALAVC